MPFFDFNSPLPADCLKGHAVVIVGAGAAGIFLATKLAARGRRVLVIESGHFKPDEDRQALNQLEQSVKPLAAPLWHRKRILGGTTTAWGGQSLPFTPLDFQFRDWVAHSGWPIDAAELRPWYADANAFMRVDGWDYAEDLFGRLHCPDPGFDAGQLSYHFSKWAPEPDFLKLNLRVLTQRVDVLYNAHLTQIDLAESGRVGTITVANFAGRSFSLPVKTVVLATGGLEACRTLLLNDHQQPGGLGNHSGWLGRAFMEHPCIDAGEIIPSDERAFQGCFATHYHRLRKYSLRLSAAPAWQQGKRLLNASAGIIFSYADEAADPFHPLKRLLRRVPASTRPVTPTQVVSAFRGLSALVHDRFLFRPGASARLTLMIEQEPSLDSYLTLGKATDRFGRRVADVHWVISALTWRTALEFTRTIEKELARLQLGRLRFDPPFTANGPDREWASYFCDVNHHMGGTRMSKVPSGGVVDPHLQVWGIPNLFVCSCSVFPTSSHSNPTLTLLALGARLEARLAGLG